MKLKVIYAIIVISLFDISFAIGQNIYRKRNLEIPQVVCHASHETQKSFTPPPPEFLLKSGAEKKSDIIVDYSLFPQDAIDAFEYAVGIWETLIESDIPIYVDARWRSMSEGSLGGASVGDYIANFENAPRKDYFYPISVAEKITKTEISGASFPDINATFNKDTRWYFGTDGDTPELLYDFVTVVLHEIGHGLGFAGFFSVSSQTGFYARPGGNVGDVSAFDLMVVNQNNEMLADSNIFEIPSTDLYKELVSNDVYSKSQAAKFKNSGENPRLHAPQIWSRGSSINHLSQIEYPTGSENSLMTHQLAPGAAIHDPGPITMGILADIGWKNTVLDFNKPKDSEEKKPIVFELNIESDTKIKSDDIFVYYSSDVLSNELDSIPLIRDAESGIYTAILNPSFETGTIYYYVSAKDVYNRTFYLPTETPEEFYSVTIGPDNESPEIEHEEIPYYLSYGQAINFSANVDDNLGVESVFVELSLNGIEQERFELTNDSSTQYSGVFDFDSNLLNDGDEIQYRIVATDASSGKNKTISPADSLYSFVIEKIFEPATGFFSDFNASSRDFIISDFDIYTEEGFENGALHSPHPYQSPNDNNKFFEFSTLLKYPIILSDNSIMRFDEVVLVEPGELFSSYGDDNFWDYVIIEGSTDFGETWLPVADGYDSGNYESWNEAYTDMSDNPDPEIIGNPDLYITRQIDLLENGNFNSGDTVMFRFRLFSDPYANGWGWAIDNLRIQTPVSSPQMTLSPGNISVYPNPVNDILNISVQSEDIIENLRVEIFNMFGQKLETINRNNIFGNYRVETDFSSYKNGMYLVIVKENGKQVYSKKIIRN